MVVIVGRRLPPFIAALIALTLALTIGAAIDRQLGGDLFDQLALVPADVWRGELWRLVTWPFIEHSPLALLFECAMLFHFAPDLHERWGRTRLIRFVVGSVVITGVATCLAAFALPAAWWFPQYAGLALGEGVLIAWALQFPASPVRVYFFFTVAGRELVGLVYGMTLLIAVFGGLAVVLPELLMGVCAMLYLRWPDARRRRRATGFGVINGDRHGGPYGTS